jgi:hypothetical protein
MNFAEALAGVEASIAAGRLDEATARLADLARALLEAAPAPELLAHATWLAAVVALHDGDQRGFERLSRDAIEGLRLAGEDERARTALASREELIGHLDDVARVQAGGSAGLMAVLDDHCALLVSMAAAAGWDDPRWPRVNRQRALLPALIALVETSTGEPAPLARVLDELQLDAIESVLLSTLAPLARAGEPAYPQRLARMCFAGWRRHDEALLRLRDDGRLARGHALVGTARGELTLAPALVARLYGGAPDSA